MQRLQDCGVVFMQLHIDFSSPAISAEELLYAARCEG